MIQAIPAEWSILRGGEMSIIEVTNDIHDPRVVGIHLKYIDDGIPFSFIDIQFGVVSFSVAERNGRTDPLSF